jgi:hypothetical protein
MAIGDVVIEEFKNDSADCGRLQVIRYLNGSLAFWWRRDAVPVIELDPDEAERLRLALRESAP